MALPEIHVGIAVNICYFRTLGVDIEKGIWFKQSQIVAAALDQGVDGCFETFPGFLVGLYIPVGQIFK
jgi:hypothetical protein